MFRSLILGFIGAFSIAPICYADGNEFLEHCIKTEKILDSKEIDLEDQFSAGVCLGLVSGVKNTMVALGNKGEINACFPKGGISNGQAVRVFTSFLKKNPASLHKNESILAILAFVNAYPCKQN